MKTSKLLTNDFSFAIVTISSLDRFKWDVVGRKNTQKLTNRVGYTSKKSSLAFFKWLRNKNTLIEEHGFESMLYCYCFIKLVNDLLHSYSLEAV